MRGVHVKTAEADSDDTGKGTTSGKPRHKGPVMGKDDRFDNWRTNDAEKPAGGKVIYAGTLQAHQTTGTYVNGARAAYDTKLTLDRPMWKWGHYNRRRDKKENEPGGRNQQTRHHPNFEPGDRSTERTGSKQRKRRVKQAGGSAGCAPPSFGEPALA